MTGHVQPTVGSQRGNTRRVGFTVVEMIVVVVIIGIIATLAVVGYRGVTDRARETSLLTDLEAASSLLARYVTTGGTSYPQSFDDVDFTPSDGNAVYYRAVPDRTEYCLVLSRDNVRYSHVSTDTRSVRGTCEGMILVPGNVRLGTSAFWVMKYEARNLSGTAASVPDGLPWTSISQTEASAVSKNFCADCRIFTEADWMALAGDVLTQAGNWSGNAVGNGYVYSGHNDVGPAGLISASADDSDGAIGTGQALTSTQRRTLTLSNGEVIWDLAGNAWEWSTGTIPAGQQPGQTSDVYGSGFINREWNNSSISWRGFPATSRPTALTSIRSLSAITTWNNTRGIGMIVSNYNDPLARTIVRGGGWNNGGGAGVLAAAVNTAPDQTSEIIGFRVVR